MLSYIKDYLPSGLSEYSDSVWAAVTHKVGSTKPMKCKFDNFGRLFVATYDGLFWVVKGSDYKDLIRYDLLYNEIQKKKLEEQNGIN